MSDLQHINVKIGLARDSKLDGERVVEIFHGWISKQASPDEGMLIDVADYRHVPEGPGILLVGLHADFGLDYADGRAGLRYNRKGAVDGDNAKRFKQALTAAARACAKLEEETKGGLKFARDGFELTVNDRALAPNAPETFAKHKPELEAFAAALGGGSVERLNADEPRRLFGAHIALKKPLDLAKA